MEWNPFDVGKFCKFSGTAFYFIEALQKNQSFNEIFNF